MNLLPTGGFPDGTRKAQLEQRAAAAALCEPMLLRDPAQAQRVLAVLVTITASILQRGDRRGEAFQALRKGLGYCWSKEPEDIHLRKPLA